MKVAIYARVSTSDQNCESQLRELREFVSKMKWQTFAEYVDTGFSGSRASRPALDRLMAEAGTKKFDAIVVWKLDRFGRSVVNMVQHLGVLESLNIRFLAISQGIDTDKANPTSRLLLHILSSIAEFEREMIRERTVSGLKAAKAKGKRLGRPKKIFRRDEVVRLRDEEGKSWRQIGAELKIGAMTAFHAYQQTRASQDPTAYGKG